MKKILLTAVLFVATAAMAQDIELAKGELSFLKGQKELNVEFDYSQLTLMKDKKSEAAYKDERAEDLNKKAKGTGEAWKKKWEGAKDGIWQPKFMELVNTIMSKEGKDFTFVEGATATKYTLIVEVVWIFPGWDVAMMKQPAKVTTNLKFVETANKSNVLALITSEEAPGDQYGSNFSNESRIGEGFAKTGKTLSKFLIKKALK